MDTVVAAADVVAVVVIAVDTVDAIAYIAVGRLAVGRRYCCRCCCRCRCRSVGSHQVFRALTSKVSPLRIARSGPYPK